MSYALAVVTTFEPDVFELRWPPQLFVDEATRLRRARRLGTEIEWLLTEAFVSTEPAEEWSRQDEQWLAELIREAGTWPEPGARRPYWSARTGTATPRARVGFAEVTHAFVQLIGEFENNGYLARVFGPVCVDDHVSQSGCP